MARILPARPHVVLFAPARTRMNVRATVDTGFFPRKVRAPMKQQPNNQYAMHARQECPLRSCAFARIANEDLPPQTG
jgi:hypothetical protein